jgi:hypothetical protein
MHRTVPIAALLVSVAVAAFGCAPMEFYEPPAAVNTPKKSATVVGSRLEVLGLVKTVDASITRVDGKHAPVYSYDKPFLIAPGAHRIVITAQEGEQTATATVDFSFEAARSYTVRATDIRNGVSEVWLEDKDTGRPAGARFRATTQAPPH